MSLIEFRKEGFYVPQADVYIDPWRRVKRALITHGHSDHSRWGHQRYLCVHESRGILRHRLGDINIESVSYGEAKHINGVKFSFHPAGHIYGSAQIRVEYKDEVWVVSGDYKVENDGFSGRFTPLKCHVFISECTFGLPIYSWEPQDHTFAMINDWWQKNRENNITSILVGYSLGKAQRLLHGIDHSIGRIYTHGAVHLMNEVIRGSGADLPETIHLTPKVKKADLAGALVITPSSATNTSWMKRFADVSIAGASGWMQLRGARRRQGADRGFILSDHADWEGLNESIRNTGAEKIFVTHGYTDTFCRWLREQGYDAHVVDTKYSSEEEETKEQ